MTPAPPTVSRGRSAPVLRYGIPVRRLREASALKLADTPARTGPASAAPPRSGPTQPASDPAVESAA